MGMKRRLLKAAGYAAAPKLAFTLQHPRKMAVAKAATWAMHRIAPQKRRPSMAATAARGFGAAAVALPVGMWLGRRVFRHAESGMG